jgi:Na+-driven multidrug efflux pump
LRDLTTGPVRSHLFGMAAPIAAGMLMQTLYYLVDLYFVGRLGDAALAGVGAAGNVMMIVIALTQVLGVGTVALIAQAVGRRDAAGGGCSGSGYRPAESSCSCSCTSRSSTG